MPKKARLNRVAEDSVNYFRNGLYCSEAILKAFNQHYKLGLPDEFLKIATGFGAGLGASKCCCGSITGGVMVLSLVHGRSQEEDPETDAFDAVAELHKRFKKEFKASCCKVLTRPVEWGSPEHHEFCEKYVLRAAEITDEILKARKKLKAKKSKSRVEPADKNKEV
ncbi:MAG: C_GCAxxG_C_C family protein [Firmicutes bacterium]|nr:C_GCAxxG_C_C family protein [Bacillota bacterium]